MSVIQTMERIEQDMRETLLTDNTFGMWYRNQSGIRCHNCYDRDDVVDAMVELDAEGFNRAVMMTRTDPIEAAKFLAELMDRAVEPDYRAGSHPGSG